MENKRSNRNYKIWFWTFGGLTLCFMAFIFSMSAQSIDESLDTSGGLTQWLAGLFYGMDTALTQEMLEPVSMLVRKTAHMTEYAILFLLSYGTVHFYGASYGASSDKSSGVSSGESRVSGGNGIRGKSGKNDRKPLPAKWKWLIAYGWTVFYAATDEFHQSFVGRGATPIDVMIDAFGALIGTVFLFGVFRILTAKSAKKKAGWVVATLAGMFCVYALSFLLFHREVFGLFF